MKNFWIFLTFLSLAKFSFQQSPSSGLQENTCSSPNATLTLYSDYLQCLSQAQNGKAIEMDAELVAEAKRQTQTCFAKNVVDAKKEKKCFFDMDTLQLKGLAWSPVGPIKNCPLCVQFARISVEAIVGANQDTAKCVRKLVFPAIAKESADCLKKNVPDFAGIPEIPDFEVEAMKNPDNALEAISVEILQNFRLQKCRERNPEWADNTEKCLKNPPIDGFMAKHCTVIDDCHKGLTDKCTTVLKKVENPTCQCFKLAGTQIKKKLLNIGKTLQQLYHNRPENEKIGAPSRLEVEQCVQAIRNESKTTANNWYEIVNQSIQKCGKSGMHFEPLLRIFCGAVIREVGVSGTPALETSFQFLSALVDAVINRLGRYCTENCTTTTGVKPEKLHFFL